MAGWDDEEEVKQKLVVGQRYYIIPMAVQAAFKERRAPDRNVDFASEPQRLSPTVLRQGVLGKDFEVVSSYEFDPYLQQHRAKLAGTPLLRNCIALADGKPTVDLYPVTVTLVGGAGGAFSTPRATPLAEVLARARALLGGQSAPPLSALRMWKVQAPPPPPAEGSSGGGGGGGGAGGV